MSAAPHGSRLPVINGLTLNAMGIFHFCGIFLRRGKQIITNNGQDTEAIMDKLKRYNHYGEDGFKYCMSEDVAALEAKNAELRNELADRLAPDEIESILDGNAAFLEKRHAECDAIKAKNAELVAAIKDWLSCEDSPQEWMRCRDKAKRALAKTEMEGQ